LPNTCTPLSPASQPVIEVLVTVSKRGLGLADPQAVEREYATEETFLARRLGTWARLDGPNAEDAALAAVRFASPRHVLDAGCGTGDFTGRVADELDVELVALDLSPRMVELTQARGVDARLGDLQALPFAAASFDCVIANRVLYHLPDLDRGLAEIKRVLRPGGRLVAVTYGVGHLRELWSLLGEEPNAFSSFVSENGGAALARYFERVERRDITGQAFFPDEASVRGYLAAYERLGGSDLTAQLPAIRTPFAVSYRHAVFIASIAS
jgi:SAM-dependent methyltransferase